MTNISDYLAGAYKDDKKEPVGIAGFTAYVSVSEQYVRTSDVPVTFLEDGTHVNDHIIRNPLQLSIEGNVSDIHLREPEILADARRAQSEIGSVTAYLPGRTQTQLSRVAGLANDVRNKVKQADEIIDRTQQAGKFLGLLDKSSKANQQSFIDHMESIYNSNQLIKIEMPFKTHENMRITSLEVRTDNTENSIGFKIDAQELRFAETLFAVVEGAAAPAGGLGGATDSPADKGVQEGGEGNKSFAGYIKGLF